MRWNHFADDPERAAALGDVLLAAALASGPLDDIKVAVVRGQVAKALGVSELPEAFVAQADGFDASRFDLAAACRVLGLVARHDRLALMKTVATVLRAEGPMASAARSFALRLAGLLEVSLPDVVAVVGMPSRPTTAPRPRPTLEMAAVGPGCSGGARRATVPVVARRA